MRIADDGSKVFHLLALGVDPFASGGFSPADEALDAQPALVITARSAVARAVLDWHGA